MILWRYAGCSIFRRGRRRPAGECPRRGGERPLIRPNSANSGGRRGCSPEHSQARRGAFFALFAGSGSPPPASARPAPRSPESAQGANSPNALTREPSGQPRTGAQGKRFSARPSAFGGVGRMRTGCASAPPSAASPSALLIELLTGRQGKRFSLPTGQIGGCGEPCGKIHALAPFRRYWLNGVLGANIPRSPPPFAEAFFYAIFPAKAVQEHGGISSPNRKKQ